MNQNKETEILISILKTCLGIWKKDWIPLDITREGSYLFFNVKNEHGETGKGKFTFPMGDVSIYFGLHFINLTFDFYLKEEAPNAVLLSSKETIYYKDSLK